MHSSRSSTNTLEAQKLAAIKERDRLLEQIAIEEQVAKQAPEETDSHTGIGYWKTQLEIARRKGATLQEKLDRVVAALQKEIEANHNWYTICDETIERLEANKNKPTSKMYQKLKAKLSILEKKIETFEVQQNPPSVPSSSTTSVADEKEAQEKAEREAKMLESQIAWKSKLAEDMSKESDPSEKEAAAKYAKEVEEAKKKLASVKNIKPTPVAAPAPAPVEKKKRTLEELRAIRDSGILSSFSDKQMDAFCDEYAAAEMAALAANPQPPPSAAPERVMAPAPAPAAVTATESVEDRPRVLTNTKLRKKMVGVPNR